MADSSGDKQEIQAEGAEAKEQSSSKPTASRFKFWKRKPASSSGGEGKPRDAVKLGCGGLFRRKKKEQQAEGGDKEGEAPKNQPKKNKSIKGGTVKIEQSPQTEMWSNVVNKSFVGTGFYKKAVVCSLTSGGVLACNPADFTPTVEQVATLRDNFHDRSPLSAAGFGVVDTVYQLQESTATDEILCGADADQTQAVLVAKLNTVLIAAVCTDQVNRAVEMLNDMREHFASQGL